MKENHEFPQDSMLLYRNSAYDSESLSSSNINDINQLLSQNKYEETYSYLESIQTLHQNNTQFLIKLAHLSIKVKKFALTEFLYLKVLSLNTSPYFDEAWFGLGQLYFIQKKYYKCISAFSSLFLINPNFPFSSLLNLKIGICYSKLKDFQNALIYLEKSLAKNDLNKELTSEALCYIGSMNLALGLNQNIFEYFEKSAGFIRNFRTGICLAWRYLQTDPNKVLIISDKLARETEIIEEIADLKLFKALSYMKLNQLKKSEKILEITARRFPKNLIIGQYLAINYEKLGKFREAAQVMENLKIVWPFQLQVLLNYYKIMKKIKRFGDAEMAKMQIFGILVIHQYSENDIKDYFEENSTVLKEPTFILTDCPLSKSQDYNL